MPWRACRGSFGETSSWKFPKKSGKVELGLENIKIITMMDITPLDSSYTLQFANYFHVH